MPPRKNTSSAKRPSDEILLTPPVSEGQANAIMRVADAHRDLIDTLSNVLPSGTMRDRVMQAQQESFLFTRLAIENDPKSFPDPKPVEPAPVEAPAEPVFEDDPKSKK